MKKKIILFSICMYLLSLGSGKVLATSFIEELPESNLGIIPCMNYISTSSCYLDKNSNGKATIDCFVGGYKGLTTKVSITASLQQYKGGRWINVKTFTKSSNSYSTSLFETVNISKGYTYRVSAQVKAYKGSSVETKRIMSNQAK